MTTPEGPIQPPERPLQPPEPAEVAEPAEVEAAQATEVEAAQATEVEAAQATEAPRRRRGARLRAMIPPLRSRRGLFILVVLMAGFGSAITVGGVVAVQWTETADFCGRCHTMGPELKAYEMSPHREVPCAECHVEPGVQGWIKAKFNGTKQLLQVLTGTFPEPIPAPDHADLPPTAVTCVKCHDILPLVANGGPIKLVLQDRYRKDEPNTRDTVALVLRPAGFGGDSETKGVHWHIASNVEYVRADERAQVIDLVSVSEPTGEPEVFIASNQVTSSSDVQPDIDRLLEDGTVRRMDCIDCHNRVGHGIPSIDQSIDSSITAGRIEQQLPYIKREGSDRLSTEYASIEDADQAIEGIRDYYVQEYPLVSKSRAGQINTAINDLKVTYRLVATPEMRVTAATYPNNIGHQTAPGCFRCHDGAHYKVVDGALTDETIPSSCATCHTFPQIGATESGVLIGQRPKSHDDRLWVFSHKTEVTSVDPSQETCGACHTRTYCENCHNTPAVKVPHDEMVFNHAAVVKETGALACALCHQPAYCSQCHSNDVLPNPFPDVTPSPSPETQ
jgi:nitrate/TMAO reductase-like tetraheme cytochrome c subunit